MTKILIYLMLSVYLLISCTSHAVISPEPLKPNESYQGVALSLENMVPQFVYRKGVGERLEVGDKPLGAIFSPHQFFRPFYLAGNRFTPLYSDRTGTTGIAENTAVRAAPPLAVRAAKTGINRNFMDSATKVLF